MAFKKKRYRKRRMRRRMWKRRSKSSTPEVKYRDASVLSYPIPIDTATDNECADTSRILEQMTAIPEGTGYQQRIGNRVYAKSLMVKCSFFTCSFTSAGIDRAVTTAQMRVVVWAGNDIAASLTNLPDFFTGQVGIRTIANLNRTAYNILYDRVFSLRNGYHNLGSTNSGAHATGDIRSIKIKIPLNRVIEYQRLSNNPKNDKDNINVAAFVDVPYSTDFNGSMPVCTTWTRRFYYTDT